MRLRESLLALLLAFAAALIVFSVVSNQQQRQAAGMSQQLLQQVYIRALREYYQWLSVVREDGPALSRTLLSPYLDTGPAQAGDWQLQFSLQELDARILLPAPPLSEASRFAMQIHSEGWTEPLQLRLDVLGWLEQLTSDLGYAALPVAVEFQQQSFGDGAAGIRSPQRFPDFLFTELTLILDAAPLQQHLLRGYTPLLSAVLAALLVLVAVWLILQQWYQRQHLSLALQDAETSLREQMRSNARQRLKLQHHTLELEGLNQHLQNARQRMELSERLAGLGELSAGIAHEINNPVAYVRSNLQTLAEDFAALAEFIDTLDKASDELDLHSPVFQRLLKAYQRLRIAAVLKEAPARLADSQTGVERVARIVSDMRNLSRSGFDKHWCQVNEDIRSAINIARSRLPAGVSLEAELIQLPDIYCNPSQIAQVVMNILVNAIQALEGRHGQIQLHEVFTGNELKISIQDDGPGMDEQTASRVFEPFFTTKLQGSGTGLGLALCYKLMQAHAGRIELTTGPGEGARFDLILPVNGGTEHVE
ncbi:hypothetical protein GJQ54_01425 [Oceanospirillaceae bacterium ASx5O]|nr:hypothetical protein GJQ54_01425 [Oceanospirillaceae bacterium ASx5O]